MDKQQEMQEIANVGKAVHKARKEEVICKMLESDDDYDMFNDHRTSAFKSLQALDLTVNTTSRVTVASSSDLSQSNKELHQHKDYETTHQELKAAHREIRDQSLELRDLKKAVTAAQERNVQLREQNTQLREVCRARSSEKLSKSDKAKYIEHFEYLDECISRLQHERQKREGHMKFLTEQTREANEEKAGIEAECRKMQRQIRELSDHLTECKDDLLRLQPTSQISDNEIAELYSNLDQQISGWVDDKTEDAEVLEEQIEKISTVDDLPDVFRGYISSDHLRMAKKYPDSQPLLLRYLIHRFLGTFVFAEDIYLFGLDPHNVALLQGLEEGMGQLEPRRDNNTLRRWRSETLLSLLHLPTFTASQTLSAQTLASTLHAALTFLIDDSPISNTSEEGWQDLHTQVIQPAIHLATKLRLSTSDYSFTPISSPNSQNPHPSPYSQTTIYHPSTKTTTLIDIATHKIIRPDSALTPSPDGRIGTSQLLISPALSRIQNDGRKIVICKASVLVKLDEAMGKRGRGIRALGAWTPSWFGGEEGGGS